MVNRRKSKRKSLAQVTQQHRQVYRTLDVTFNISFKLIFFLNVDVPMFVQYQCENVLLEQQHILFNDSLMYCCRELVRILILKLTSIELVARLISFLRFLFFFHSFHFGLFCCCYFFYSTLWFGHAAAVSG